MNFGAVRIPAGRSIAKSVDLTGAFRVTEPGDLMATLDKALNVVTREKRQALVNVVCGDS